LDPRVTLVLSSVASTVKHPLQISGVSHRQRGGDILFESAQDTRSPMKYDFVTERMFHEVEPWTIQRRIDQLQVHFTCRLMTTAYLWISVDKTRAFQG
jgi:hypothetical protein